METRRLTITETVEPRRTITRHDRRYPSLRLAGLWLEAAGFKAGQAVAVTVEAGRLVIQHPQPGPGAPTRAEVEAVRAVINAR